MPRGPSYHGRRTPLPGVQRGSHLKVAPDRFHREDRHVGLEHTVKVHPHPSTLHEECLRMNIDGFHEWVCPKCAWLLELDTERARYFAAHLDDEDDRR